MTRATARAHPNIALVKYWGKRDVERNLPAAGSLSMTLAGLATTTTVGFGAQDTEIDTLTINGRVAAARSLEKALAVVDFVRRRAALELPVRIETVNDFPTGAGLASSASGMAALAVAASRAAGLELSPTELSVIARLGSGSACRSIFGGFVEWQAGTAVDGSDSHARMLLPPEHWDLRVVVAIVSEEPKEIGSTRGMIHSQQSSPYHARFLETVGADLTAARQAVKDRHFDLLRRVAERSCLRMHAAIMAADPPLFYLRPETWKVVEVVRALQHDVPAFFTIDAGPNVKVFCPPDSVPAVDAALGELDCVRRRIHARPGGGAEVVSE